ncbi:MAG: NAD-glutamate dehydrogenase [Alphaproteobacteria bacterium]|nr:NAD-glutamate dehydrogenase [Alphaproteobacteria bacterium]
MAARGQTRKAELVEQVATLAAERLQGAAGAQAAAFARAFYANVPAADVGELEAETLYAMAVSFWQFGQQRRPGEPKLRVYTPRPAEHGWKSPRTIIEIVTDDMPFLVDSVTGEINHRGLAVHLVIHPIRRVERSDGHLTALSLYRPDAAAGAHESCMHFQVGEIADAAELAVLADAVRRVLADVRAAVTDWQPMLAAARGAAGELGANPAGLPADEIAEAQAFIGWLLDDHFTFLGWRIYDYIGDGDGQTMRAGGCGLGVLRDPARRLFENGADDEPLPEEVRAFLREPAALTVTKANERATVHRRVHMDVIALKRHAANGKVTGEHIIAGLFTSEAYNRSPRAIPLLRRKIATVLGRAGFLPASHDRKALANILETYPRDELLQIGIDGLYDNAIGILHLQERRRVALFVREDPFRRYVTALVFVPRERYNTELRQRMAAVLERAFGGVTTAWYPEFATESVLARVLFVIRPGDGGIPAYSVEEITGRLREATRFWADQLQSALVEARGEARGQDLFRRYGEAFGAGYRDATSPETAVLDIDFIERAFAGDRIEANLHRVLGDSEQTVRLKLYHPGRQLPLSDILPMLENMGLRVIGEVPADVRLAGDGAVWVHDFEMTSRNGAAIDLGAVRDAFHAAFLTVFRGEAADDGFNRLVLGAGLEWREIVVLRACCRFLLQARVPFSQAYMEETLARNPELARQLVALFAARFDPGLREGGRSREATQRIAAARAAIEAGLEAVGNLDEDRILRRFWNVIEAMLRTNFYQPAADGAAKPYLSFKLDSRAIDELPLPRPRVEVWVYAARMEGCHLRGEKVARGGIRWSDRREDFRTEILGLQKAQTVKNAVIVPVGAKGGFVVKRPPVPTGDAAADRQALQAEGIECYRTLMRGLLDVTDNRSGDRSLPPAHVVRYDEDDPYLVVAADKGTASFSDIANAISAEYGFWLGDAFASGGSAGYDHKKMAITARGAWESVKRHFREIGHDTQSADFTVVGVGDMSGDVFGNGMLQSPHIRLVAAFDHHHIFVDPAPDAAASFAERKRLFELPRSSWADYDAKLISPGGGVFDRRAKAVRVSPEIAACLGIAKEQVTPAELAHAILAAEVDLLWFGGIGTFVKSSRESHVDADDRANDALRADATMLRAKVVGEGANLGVTQRGRIEYALAGGRINTDFIDNSAGVDCSDHEVNIKIALDGVVADSGMTGRQRDRLLAGMTGQVASLVLRDNYLQTQAISQAQFRGAGRLERQWRLLRFLERGGRLTRALEFLPDDEAFGVRLAAGTALTRPEYAVLFSHTKIWLGGEILASDVPDDPRLAGDLLAYFPTQLAEHHGEQLARHRLRREIVATSLTNALVNRAGVTFVDEVRMRTGAAPAEVARAWVVVRDAFDLPSLWAGIEALDALSAADIQGELFLAVERLAESRTLWFLKNLPQPLDIGATVARFAPGIGEIAAALDDIGAADDLADIATQAGTLAGRGVPDALARRIAALDVLAAACDIIRIAEHAQVPVNDAGRVYFAIGARLGIDWLRDTARRARADGEWQKLALDALADDTYAHQAELTTRVLAAAGRGSLGRDAADGLIGAWMEGRQAALARVSTVLDEIKAANAPDLAMLTVANGQLRALVTG